MFTLVITVGQCVYYPIPRHGRRITSWSGHSPWTLYPGLGPERPGHSAELQPGRHPASGGQEVPASRAPTRPGTRVGQFRRRWDYVWSGEQYWIRRTWWDVGSIRGWLFRFFCRHVKLWNKAAIVTATCLSNGQKPILLFTSLWPKILDVWQHWRQKHKWRYATEVINYLCKFDMTGNNATRPSCRKTKIDPGPCA